MSKEGPKLDKEIDAGKFFMALFYIFFAIGMAILLTWYYFNVYKPEEKAYINSARYAYKIFYDEIMGTEGKPGYAFGNSKYDDINFCQHMVDKYSKTKIGYCNNFNPITPVENFVFKDKKYSVLGLEKPSHMDKGVLVKDIIIDYNTEQKGENRVGVDRAIMRLYLTGNYKGTISPVNCNKQDELEYGLKSPLFCAGSTGLNEMALNIPLGYDIEQTNTETGEIKYIGKNLPILKADCRAFDGNITDPGEYCSDKMLYTLKGCDDDEYICKMILTKY